MKDLVPSDHHEEVAVEGVAPKRRMLDCPKCREIATVKHFIDSPGCAAAVATLNGMLNLGKRKTPPKAGPGRRPKETVTVTRERGLIFTSIHLE